MTDLEIKTVTQLLKKLEPGLLPLSIFNEITRIFVSSIVEIVPLKKKNGVTQVLLVRRESDDPFWPNMWHTPGTVLRATDRKGDLNDAFQRILNSELGCTEEITPIFVDIRFSQSTRGSEFSAIYYINMVGKTKNGEWFDASSLPQDLVKSQGELIKKAVDGFEEKQKTN